MSKLIFLKFSFIVSAVLSMSALPASGASIPSNLGEKEEVEITSSAILSTAAQTSQIASAYNVFVPKTKTNPSVIDYQVWDEALRNIVLRLGQSTRIRSKRPSSETGTRIAKGHKSAYRLEGSRVTFSYLNDEYRTGLTEYRQDLERIANKVDITKLARNEQLAFWFNLHIVTLIEQIALNYPVRRPSKLRVGLGKQPLHEAKLLNIR